MIAKTINPFVIRSIWWFFIFIIIYKNNTRTGDCDDSWAPNQGKIIHLLSQIYRQGCSGSQCAPVGGRGMAKKPDQFAYFYRKNLKVFHNISLRNRNTFCIDIKADRFISIENEQEAESLFKDRTLISGQSLIIGAGSNMLFTGDFAGTVLHSEIGGIRVEEINNEEWRTEKDVAKNGWCPYGYHHEISGTL